MPLIPLQHTTHISVPPAGFEPTIPAGDWPQTLTLDCSVTGIGIHGYFSFFYVEFEPKTIHSVASQYTYYTIAAPYTVLISCM